MNDFAHIKRCFELSDEEVATATETRESTKALLLHLARIAQPNTGCAKVLLVFARMATSACEWIDGDLHVVIATKGDGTAVDVFTELGLGMRERLFPQLVYPVPLDEFVRAIERVPDRVRPLVVVGQSAKKIALAVTAAIRKSSLPPPPVRIADDSVFVPTDFRMKAAPKVEGPAPTLPIISGGLPLVVSETRRARKTSRPPKAASSKPPALAKPPLPRFQKRADAPTLKASPAPSARKSVAPSKSAPLKKSVPPTKSVPPKQSVPPKKSVPPKRSVHPKKSAPPKKSVPPARRVDPRAEPEDEEAIDSGWGDPD